MRKNIIKQLAYLILPTVIFYICYAYMGILYAMLASLAFTLAAIVSHYVKYKRLTNTQVFGVIGLALSFIAIIYTDNEKLYYVPALVNNCVFACFAIALSIKRKSIFHYVTKDFNLPWTKNIAESECVPLNILWLAFFLLKIVSKVVGILFLDFKVLYWLVFILGDPMTIALVAYSIFFLGRKISVAQKTQE